MIINKRNDRLIMRVDIEDDIQWRVEVENYVETIQPLSNKADGLILYTKIHFHKPLSEQI